MAESVVDSGAMVSIPEVWPRTIRELRICVIDMDRERNGDLRRTRIDPTSTAPSRAASVAIVSIYKTARMASNSTYTSTG